MNHTQTRKTTEEEKFSLPFATKHSSYSSLQQKIYLSSFIVIYHLLSQLEKQVAPYRKKIHLTINRFCN